MVLGKHSGRHAFRQRVEELGFDLDEAELDRAFLAFKQLADRKKDVYDADIEALVLRTDPAESGPWRIVEMHITSGSGSLAAAALRVAHQDGRSRREAAAGDGPVEAAFRAIQRATGIEVKLKGFDIRNVTTGKDAQGEAIVTVDHFGTTYRGTGLDTDIVEASALAFLQAINRICRAGNRPAQPEHAAADLSAAGAV
jgi:2-isopropylmalate synthase